MTHETCFGSSDCHCSSRYPNESILSHEMCRPPYPTPHITWLLGKCCQHHFIVAPPHDLPTVVSGKHGPMFTWTSSYEGVTNLNDDGKPVKQTSRKTRVIVEGVDPRSGLYPEGEWSGRALCMINTSARIGMYPYVVPLKLIEGHR